MPKWWHLEQYNNETGYNVIYNFYHHRNTCDFFCCSSLSDEVLLNILKYLSVKELCRCASVCVRLNELIHGYLTIAYGGIYILKAS